jgi:Tol biopolymer transport system component
MRNRINISLVLFLLLASACNSANLPQPVRDNSKFLFKPDDSPALMYWSPDGEKLLITDISWMNYNSSLEIYDTSGKKSILLEIERGILIANGWSPDGSRVVFSGNDNTDFKRGIWFSNITAPFKYEFVSEGIAAAWGPTDNYLAIASEPGVVSANIWEASLFIRNLDLNTDRTIFTNEAPYFSIDRLAWSPNGEMVAYNYQHGENGEMYHDISIVDINTGKVTSLTTNSDSYDPSWSPTGNMLAYETIESGYSVLNIINADGSCSTDILNILNDVGAFAWSPKGQIAVVLNHRIYLIDALAILGERVSSNGIMCH